MKTKGEFLTAKKAFDKRMISRVFALLAFVLLMAALRFIHLPHGAFAWMPTWFAIVFFGLLPFVIIHQLAYGINRSARDCGLVCSSCGKDLFCKGTKIDKVLALNECPFCGHSLYIK
jgi:hypothetical protein